MAITSKGYAESLSYADWAEYCAYLGADFSVGGLGDFAATPSGGSVSIAAGKAIGRGIIDTSDAATVLTPTPVVTGDRWDLVVLRRTWAEDPEDSASQILLLPGSTFRAVPGPPTRKVGAGIQDDQPLWLVRFTAGMTGVQDLDDLRLWAGHGGSAAKSLLVRQYLERIGSTVWINGVVWTRAFNADSTDGWKPVSPYVGTTPPPYGEDVVWIKKPA